MSSEGHILNSDLAVARQSIPLWLQSRRRLSGHLSGFSKRAVPDMDGSDPCIVMPSASASGKIGPLPLSSPLLDVGGILISLEFGHVSGSNQVFLTELSGTFLHPQNQAVQRSWPIAAPPERRRLHGRQRGWHRKRICSPDF